MAGVAIESLVNLGSAPIFAMLLEPVFASLLAVVVVQEPILDWGWVSIAAVVLGLLVASRM